MKIHLAQFPALFLLVLAIVLFWGSRFFLHRSNRVFSPPDFIHIMQTMIANPPRHAQDYAILHFDFIPVNLVISNSQLIHQPIIKIYSKNER